MIFEVLPIWGCGLGVAIILFTITWILSVRLDNYSFVDVTWSYALSFMAPVFVVLGSGWPQRRAMALVLALTWSVRLGTYLLGRIRRHHPVEDSRYQGLRAKWQPGIKRAFFLFFQAQALVIWLMAIPFVLMVLNPADSFHPLEWCGATVGLIGVVGEALSDAQRQAFRRVPENRARICQVGLWRWSRHPNYFFEAVYWIGVATAASASPWGWISWTVPALILYFLLKVTGIPLSEEQELKRYGADYEAYQRRTSRFIPWFPQGASTPVL